MQTNGPARVAATIVALEALGLLALAGWQLVALISGDTGSVATAVALLVLTLVGAAAVGAFAFGTWRGSSWGRSGAVVTQILILAVALGAITGAFADPTVAGILAIPGIAGLIALAVAARSARGAEPPASA